MERRKSADFRIRLDRKGRLVLPLEIRDAIGIKTGDKIILSVSAAQGGKVVMELAKAPDNVESCACSRNAGYVEDKPKKTWRCGT